MCTKIVFALVAIACSCWYAWYAVTIHVSKSWQLDTLCEPRNIPPPHWSWWAHQMWLNFVGSLTGWAAVAYFVFYRVHSFKRQLEMCGKMDFGVADGFFLLVALLGITGLLPWRLFNSPVK